MQVAKFELKNIIAEFLPSDVSLVMSLAAKTTPSVDLDSCLSPGELEILNRFRSKKRCIEFSLGRITAKEAISQQKLLNPKEATEILRDLQGKPVWPNGVVGSISHCSYCAVAIVGNAAQYFGMGLDIITSQRIVNPQILATLCSDSEREYLIGSWKEDFNSLCLTVFSVKESLYKLFSNLEFKNMEWHDFKLIETRVYQDGTQVEFKVKLPQMFFKKTGRVDLKSQFEFSVFSNKIEEFLLSWILYPKN